MVDRLIVFGSGGHAKVVIEAYRAGYPEGELAVLDDRAELAGTPILGMPIRGGRAWLDENWLDVSVMPAIGNNQNRATLMAELCAMGRPLASVVHPSAIVSPTAVVGAGCFLAAGAIVNAQAQLDAGVIVNTAASVDHDCLIGAAAHIAPGARLCGSVRIGSEALVGVGAAIIPGIRVGRRARIGAGSAVVDDIPDDGVWGGCPARPLKDV